MKKFIVIFLLLATALPAMAQQRILLTNFRQKEKDSSSFEFVLSLKDNSQIVFSDTITVAGGITNYYIILPIPGDILKIVESYACNVSFSDGLYSVLTIIGDDQSGSNNLWTADGMVTPSGIFINTERNIKVLKYLLDCKKAMLGPGNLLNKPRELSSWWEGK